MDLTSLQWFWMLALAFALLIYLILDGFDLGVGILFGTTRNDAWRSTMMRTIAPVWDGNETWLLAAGAGLYAAFPVVYAIFFSALYLPVVLMLCGLMFRGVAFEFRVRATRHRKLWDGGFFAGSLVVSFVQGAAVGALIEELAVEQGQYVGGPLDWLSPFAVICGIGLVAGYSLHGACWLVAKTRGELREWAWRRIPWLDGSGRRHPPVSVRLGAGHGPGCCCALAEPDMALAPSPDGRTRSLSENGVRREGKRR